jgi:hypothetical protein
MAAQKQSKQAQSSHQTRWAAQFAVASELCKRGYEVALTVGNHPLIDLMVISPKNLPCGRKRTVQAELLAGA